MTNPTPIPPAADDFEARRRDYLARAEAQFDRLVADAERDHPNDAKALVAQLRTLRTLGLLGPLPDHRDRSTASRTSRTSTTSRVRSAPRTSGKGGEERIGPYRILRELNRGGQGVVYLAEDPRFDRRVALKVMRHLASASPAAHRRFQREAEIASRLDHPTISPVLDVGVHAGVPYLAMPFVEGESLADVIARARQEGEPPAHGEAAVAETLRLFESIARGLDAAHRAGVIHRDIKPSNLMITKEGRPVILDFGLASDADDDASTLTERGDAPGTAAYMSPEQIAGAPDLDARSDVFSLGVTLFERLTGELPFDRRAKRGGGAPGAERPSIRSHGRALPTALRTVLDTAMAGTPERRYESAADFAEDLRRVRSHEPIVARPVSWVRRAILFARRRPARATALLAALIALTAVSASATYVVVNREYVAARSARATKDIVERALASGFRALAADDDAAARTAFDHALRHAPDHPDAIAGLALLTYRRQDPARAIERLTEPRSDAAATAAHAHLAGLMRGATDLPDVAGDAAPASPATEARIHFYDALFHLAPDASSAHRARAWLSSQATLFAAPENRLAYHDVAIRSARRVGLNAYAARIADARAHRWPDAPQD